MAGDPAAQTDQAEEAPAATPPKAKRWMTPAVIGGAALFGILTARFAVAPQLTANQDEHAEAESGASTEQDRPVGRMFEVGNLVVNPAGSHGTRFVMASVALEVTTELEEQTLIEREPHIRDLITSVFEARDLQELTMPGARDSLKEALRVAVAELLNPGADLQVYLPQFVIQFARVCWISAMSWHTSSSTGSSADRARRPVSRGH